MKTATKPQHSPTPWLVSGDHITCMPTATIIAETCSPCPYDPGDRQQHANAAHIVRCVNSHDALLAACKHALEFLTQEGRGAALLQPDLRAAIAAAEGG